MKNVLKTLWLLIPLFLSVCSCTTHDPSPQEIDDLANETLSEWDIPGLALAVVHKGKQVKVAGYGVRQKGFPEAVTEETIFQICSMSKAFTATSVGMLVEEGTLDWEKPIITWLPRFQLKDDYVTKNITLQDLLCHRTGLPGTSKQCWRLWYNKEQSSDELMYRLKDVDLAYPFRSHFSYNNMAYLVASKVVEKASGQSWQQFCKEKIFSPLAMTRTNASYNLLSQDNNVASAHQFKDVVSWENLEVMAPAGGINSCASDMAKWLLYCISAPSPINETQKPQTLVEEEGLLDPSSIPLWSIRVHDQKIVNYGYGWMMYTLQNRRVLFHTGGINGMQSIIAIVPEEQLGIAILTNKSPHLGTLCLLNELLDRFLHLPQEKWHQKAFKKIEETNTLLTARIEQINASKRQQGPSLPLHEYTGYYEHPAYGRVHVLMNNDHLEVELFSHERGTLENWDKDKFELKGIPSAPPTPWIVDFELSQDRSHIATVKMPDLGVFKRETSSY